MGKQVPGLRRVLLFGVAIAVLKYSCLSQSAGQDGRIHLDVVVSDATGKPVSGLGQKDFQILDDGVGRPIATFAAFDGVTAKADPPAQKIIVIDSVNNGFVEKGYLRQWLESFLRENGGHLKLPSKIAQLVPSGVQFLSQPSADGNALATIVCGLRGTVKPRGLDTLQESLNGLVAIARKEENEPGRKLLVWLGPGWGT